MTVATITNTPHIQLRPLRDAADLEATRLIFREYAAGLGIDLCFQDFDAELAELPGDYAQPRGTLLLAWVKGTVAGCCALRPLDSSDYANAAEMKRLYVRKAFRQLGLGRCRAVERLRQCPAGHLERHGNCQSNVRRPRLQGNTALLSQPLGWCALFEG